MSKKRSKLFNTIIIILIFFVIIILFTYKKNYKINYKVKNFNIKEEYYKPLNQYIFKIKKSNNIYEFSIKENYQIKKKLINDVLYKNGCMTPKSKLKLYTVCFYNGKFSIKGKEQKKLNSKYKKIKYNKSFANIFIWNHKGYTFLNEKKQINLFKKEFYDNNKSISFENYLITPDLEGNHGFKKVYVIDMKKGKLRTISFETKISYDFYYLGVKDNKIYIVDKKNKMEYALNLRRKRLELITKDSYGKVWKNTWKEVSMVKLSYQNYKFVDKKIYNYKIVNKNLYLTYNLCKNEILIDKNVNKVLASNEDVVYYLKDNKVYFTSNSYSKSTLLEYNELYFNSKNQVFIYNTNM